MPAPLLPPPPDAAAPASPAIVAAPLAAPAPDSMGLVDARSGGFPDTLWQGTSAEIARALIAQLPRRYATVSARHLAERFLLSAAAPSPTPGETPPSRSALLEARMTALAALGDWTDALALADLVAPELRTAEMQHMRVEGLLVQNKVDAACGDVQHAMAQAPEPYWQQVQVLCQFASGQNAAAGLTISLLHEQGLEDRNFFWAAEALQGPAGAPPSELVAPGAKVAPLVLAMLRQSHKQIPAPLLETGDPTTLMIAAQLAASNQPTPAPAPAQAAAAEAAEEARILTLERAVTAGVADAEVLRTTYAAAKFRNDAAETKHIAGDTPRQRALTYQLAVAQSEPNSRAEVIARALNLAHGKDGAAPPVAASTVAQVYLPFVLELAPAGDLAWFAGTAVRVLLAAQSAGLADPRSTGQSLREPLRSWLDLALSMSVTSPDAKEVNDKLWPYRQLATGGAIAADSLQAWRASFGDAPPQEVDRQTRLLLGLLSAVGDGVSLADWQPLIVDSEPAKPILGPTLPMWHALSLAVRGHRLGEAVGLSLKFLGMVGPALPSELTYDNALQSLVAVDHAADARAIAVELALAGGL
jgi:hypothetical protein